jgi:carbon monoxide dehydrogenase subunit G
MNVTGECTVSASREAVFDKLADPFFFASCFDGVSGLTETGPGRYDASFETTVAYMKFRFKMQVEMVRLANRRRSRPRSKGRQPESSDVWRRPP